MNNNNSSNNNNSPCPVSLAKTWWTASSCSTPKCISPTSQISHNRASISSSRGAITWNRWTTPSSLRVWTPRKSRRSRVIIWTAISCSKRSWTTAIFRIRSSSTFYSRIRRTLTPTLAKFCIRSRSQQYRRLPVSRRTLMLLCRRRE